MLILTDTIFHWLGKGRCFKIYKVTQEMRIKHCVCVCEVALGMSRSAAVWTVARQAPLSVGFSACWPDCGSRWTQGPPHLWRNGVGR